MKNCAACKIDKEIKEFNKWSLSRDGLNARCRSCTRTYNNSYYHDSGKEQRKIWHLEGGKEYKKDYNLRYYFNITIEQYNEMLSRQQGKCAGCLNEFEVLCVDHDHKTGKIRGLLCGSCNRALGGLKDDPEILARLIEYLQVKT